MTRNKVGVVGIPGKWSTEVLADAVAEKTGFRLVVDMAKVSLDLNRGVLEYSGHDLSALDGLIVKKISSEYSPNTLDRLEMLRIAEEKGVQVFSPATSMLRLVDRLSCSITLSNQGVPMPDTLITENIDAATAAVHRFGAAVFKPLFSTKARGMCVIASQEDSEAIREQILNFKQQNPMMYIQRKVNLPGQDLGLVFLGGQYVGAYARVSQTNSWNTTIHDGGRYAPVSPPQEWIDIAHQAQAPFNLDFTTVDLAETEQGPVVFEVSAFGGFRGALEGAGLDAARMYADYVLQRLEQND